MMIIPDVIRDLLWYAPTQPNKLNKLDQLNNLLLILPPIFPPPTIFQQPNQLNDIVGLNLNHI
jgi:hypothetical protein